MIKYTLAVCVVAGLCVSTSAFALFNKLSTNLVGVNGTTGSGTASVDQSNYPKTSGSLAIKVSNINAVDGTVLSVTVSDCLSFGAVAFLKLSNHSAELTTSLPQFCQVGRNASINVYAPGDVLLLKGGNPWKI